MSDAVQRFIGALASATGIKSRQYTDPFENTQWALAEMVTALDLATHCVRGIQSGRIEKSVGRMIDRHRELDRLIKQVSTLNDAIGRICSAHVERKQG